MATKVRENGWNPLYRSGKQSVTGTIRSINTVYISGQVSVDENQNLIGAGDLKAQALRAFQNLEIALTAAAAKTTDVVKLNIYVKGYEPENAVPIGEALRKYFPGKNLPASTWLGVQSLAKEGFLIEVDAIAVVAK